MKKSWIVTATFLAAALSLEIAFAQWFSGPSLNSAAGSSASASGNPAAPPIVQLPPVSNPVATPSTPAAVQSPPTPQTQRQPAAMPPYNPIVIQPQPLRTGQAPEELPAPQVPTIVAQQPTTSPAASYQPPLPTPAVPRFAGSGSYSSQAPSSFTLPSFGVAASPGTVASPYAAAGVATGPAPALPMGSLSKSEMHPYARPPAPPSWSAWVPTKVASLVPRSWTGSSPAPSPTPPACDPYNYNPAAPPIGSYCCDPAACGRWYDNLTVFGNFDAFKSPVDLDGLNGNFGKRFGAFGAFPLLRDWGIGGQLGGSGGWYDWKGTQYTGHDVRFQNFISAGIFQRSASTGLGWAIVHDWLNDDYYADLHLSQFRVAGSWQFNPSHEIGVWAALPQARDEAFVGTPAVLNRFETLLQGNFYWRHMLSDWATATWYAGLAESPADVTTGTNVEVAINPYMMLTGSVVYVWPGSGGNQGRQEEMWNVTLGVSIYPGTAMQSFRSQFRPFLPMADNGNFNVQRQ